ncbi:hypothetical protein JX266_006986 [Neoarthrinium moseri]|nr:hypothetical protein JX266_006986 [Neoarthrinium moseri]
MQRQRFRFVFAVILSLHLCVASPSQNTHVIHEQRMVHGNQWTKGNRLEPGRSFALKIGLKQQNLDAGGDLVYQVSHPSSPDYARYYSPEEVVEKFAPSGETIDNVRSWISSNGGSSILSRDKGWLHVNMTVAEAESMLSTQYYEYKHISMNRSTISCEEYSVPKAIRDHIDFITPGVVLMTSEPSQTRKRSVTGASTGERFAKRVLNDTSTCSEAITPMCIRELYKIPENTLNHTNNSLGIYEYGDYYAQEDLDLFFTSFAPRIPNGTHPTLVSIDGGFAPVTPGAADGESDLDFQVAYPLIYPQSITLYQAEDKIYTISGGGGLFNNFLNAIDGSYCSYSAFGEAGNDPKFDNVYPDTKYPGGYLGETQCGIASPTNVISISYSKSEFDLPFYYQQRQCNEFMKLALQGHTILVASGDAGVAARPWDPSPNGCIGTNHTIFSPNFPGNCPYVTTVGGTKLPAGAGIDEPEVAAYLPNQDRTDYTYTSGGGFSTIYSTPSYQSSALGDYFKNHDPGYKSFSSLHNATHNDSSPVGANGGVYNRIGRGMPDVSAISQDIVTYIDVDYGLLSGTSAATPLIASIVTLINENRLKAGKSPVGFINPVLYENPQLFNDITSGNNEGCGTKGFSAVQGWDPVTGLGTPKYPEMLELFMSLP